MYVASLSRSSCHPPPSSRSLSKSVTESQPNASSVLDRPPSRCARYGPENMFRKDRLERGVSLMSDGFTNSVDVGGPKSCSSGPRWSDRNLADVVDEVRGWCASAPCHGKNSSSIVRLEERTFRLIAGTHTSHVPIASGLRPMNMPTHPREASVVFD